MRRARTITIAAGLCLIGAAAPARAEQQMYTYSVVHPFYGEIGTRTDMIDHGQETFRIVSRLRIAVELLGIVVYRQESDTTEIMHGNRLVSLESVSEKDGEHLEVHGMAKGDQFVVNSTAGSFTGAATTAPSDPWVLKGTGEGALVYPSTGRIIQAQVSGGEDETFSVNGASFSVRHFVVMGENREDVWLDPKGIPVMFRTDEGGTPIDFVLQNSTAARAIFNASVKHPAPGRLAIGSK